MSVLSQFLSFGRSRRVYLDYAAATPVREDVFDAMQPYFEKKFANPGAIHEEGQEAARVVAKARARIGDVLRTPSDTIVFTSGGTEANNLALIGTVHHALGEGREAQDIEIITTEIEHPSVLEAVRELKKIGVIVTYTPVDTSGNILLEELKKRINAKTLLISFSYVNSEVGTVADVQRITHLVRTYKKKHPEQKLFVHLDAAQAPLWLPCRFDSLGVDYMSLDAGKMYGPKGVGALVRKRGTALSPILFGGGQEVGLRPGTENVPLIVGFAEALVVAQSRFEKRSVEVKEMREYCIERLEKEIEGVTLHGTRTNRVANNVNISIKGVAGEYAVVALDVGGVAASTKSACGGKKTGGSYVVRALTGDDTTANETIRLTLGEETKKSDIDAMLKVLKAHVSLVRSSN